MNSRLTLIFSTLVILLAGMIWIISERPAAIITAMAVDRPVAPAASVEQPHVMVAPAVVELSPPAPAAFNALTIAPPQVKTAPMVHVNPAGEMRYTARAGDTVSQLAIALLGSDSKEHRDLIIAANTTLQANPDRVLTGQTYSIGIASVQAVDRSDSDQRPEPTVAAPVAISSVTTDKMDDKPETEVATPKMKYIAQPGDTVSTLAADLLGGNTKANRETIIAGNTSLQQDPDRMVAGKSYTIRAPNGLSAAADSAPAQAPTSQPDSDEIIRRGADRSLRYTAQPGDTVSKLAEALLGSDTRANRELIIKVNPSLKQDPDHLIAGQTYWISAPGAE